MTYLPIFIITAFLVLLLWRSHLAFIFFIVCKMLLPPIVRIGSISMNTLMAVLLIVAATLDLIKNRKHYPKKQFKEITLPVIYLIVPLAIIGVFANLGYSFQIKSLLQFFVTEISPYISLLVLIKTKKQLLSFINVLLISYCVISVYGIYTYVIKMNPLYIFFVANYTYGYEVEDYTGDGFGSIRGALTGAASGNLSGPLPWGQESMLVALFLIFNKYIKNKRLLILTIILASINVFLSGKRSCLTPLLIAFAYFLFIRRNVFTLKRILYIAGVALALFITINLFPQLEKLNKNLTTSIFFWNDQLAEKQDVGGSSLEMRLDQFNYANNMIADNPLFGLGYDWPSYYSKKNGEHPYMHGFESIYLRTIVESGLIGLIVWTVFFVRFYRLTNNRTNHKESLVFHLCFILSCILTGIQASMWIYMLLGGTLLLQKRLVISKSELTS